VSVCVSVVVPVYNPGEHIEPCIRSLLRQTMPTDRLELIFVDDGSTDQTPARLDRLAAEHPHVRVIHEENSGWAGKPRNTGVRVASGDYIQFVDQDDWLGDEALQRLHRFAVANDSDIVVGKMVGVGGRGVPRQLFRRSVPRATLADTALMDSLTPHKMFRRAFLAEHDLTFPEGPRRLEDHVFVVSAYLHAQTISVLSDYPCYYHIARDDGGNAGFRPLEPAEYFRDLRDALDAVDALTTEGPLRDRLHRRWLRVEMVERLRGERLLRAEPGYRAELVHEVAEVMKEHFAPGVAAGLGPAQRLVAQLARDEDLDGLLALARWEAGTAARATLDGLAWDGDRLRLAASAELVAADGTPVTLRDGRLAVPLPHATRAGLPPEALDFRGGSARVDLTVRHRGTGEERFLATGAATSAADGDGTVGGRVEAVLDPAAARGGQELGRGTWEVWVKVRGYGWERSTRVGSSRAAGVVDAIRPGLVGAPPLLVTPSWTGRGELALEVGQPTTRPAAALRVDLAGSTVQVAGSELTVSLRLPLQLSAPAPAKVRLTSGVFRRSTVTRPAVLDPAAPGAATLRWAVEAASPARATWRLALRPDDVEDGPWWPLRAGLVHRPGRPPGLAPSPRLAARAPAAVYAASLVAAQRARSALRPWARAGVRRLSPRLRAPVQALARSRPRGPR
jgi:glycosyltransferase involved in cell wall biosynthesis